MQAQTVEEIVHALLALTISAAALFVKNPNSQAHAATMVTVGTNVLLPLADQLVERAFAAPVVSNIPAILPVVVVAQPVV